MKKIVDSIVKKQNKIEDESDSLRQRLAYALAEKEDWQDKYNLKDENYQKL